MFKQVAIFEVLGWAPLVYMNQISKCQPNSVSQVN